MTMVVGETCAIVRIQTRWECTVTVNCVLYIYVANSQVITTEISV